jgi:hypothetical protein
MTRPYSISELKDLEREVYSRHRLSDTAVVHTPCLHRYRVKKGGRKEQFISSTDGVLDDQTCSVCFKIRTSGDPPNDCMEKEFELSKKMIDDIDIFYKWLYRHDY